MFDKFSERVKRFGWCSPYAQLDSRARRHHERLKVFLDTLPRKLTCQECGGGGGWTEAVLDDGTGPWFECGFCEGLGYITPWMRGQWLRWKRNMRSGRAA